MCGFVGFWTSKNSMDTATGLNVVQAMADNIQSRGPDSSGIWAEDSAGLFLGHRRLSILDLTEAGHQPMISKSGKSIISYNGEVFNFEELKQKLVSTGVEFKGHSDTEVILEACERWGVVKTCEQLIGMFAFAFWDREKKLLYLVRDRLGIKPLYWGVHQKTLFFGSQPKAFMPHPDWQPRLNQDALVPYFRFNYVPAPLSIFEGIQKLSTGTVLEINADFKTKETQFWNLETVVSKGLKARNHSLSEQEAVEQLDSLLRDAVKRRMISDVPLGAFLSGGVDSSTVVALMQAQSSKPIKTFSIGFKEEGYNEAPYAKAVAEHLKTEHHELYLESNDAQSIIPNIPAWFDEPFADVSQIPTFLVSRLARQFVTVALSGDGGDELFAGYTRYTLGCQIWQKMRFLPYWLRSITGLGLRQISVSHWEKIARVVPNAYRFSRFGEKVHRLADVLSSKKALDFYKLLCSQWENPEALVLRGKENILYPWNSNLSEKLRLNLLEQMQFTDTLSYLPDDILTKVDRASMAVSLEARVPLLDHRVVALAWSLPNNLLVRQGKGKWILREVLKRYIPMNLIERPKMGFGVPIDSWLRGPLHEWANELLSLERIKREGILNAELIQQRWQEHQSGRRNWQYALWGVLMFQAWREHWKL